MIGLATFFSDITRARPEGWQAVFDPGRYRKDWGSGYNSWWGSAGGLGMTQNVVQNTGNAGMEMDDALTPGQIGVTARVTVSFELEE